MLGRRGLLRSGLALAASGGAGAAYAGVIEPGFRLIVQRYAVAMAGWGDRPPLTICAIADLHAGMPWMTLPRVERIVEAANAVRPDVHVILGDLPGQFRYVKRVVDNRSVAHTLAQLRAPLGRYAILGNHDWWDDPRYAQLGRTGGRIDGPPEIHGILEQAGIPVLANGVTRLPHGAGVWLAGTDSAWIYRVQGRMVGMDDLDGTLAQLTDDAPAVLLAHEPDIFTRVPGRVGLTMCGHTHGGQIRVAGHSFVVPSMYGNRFAYGHIREAGHSMVVSGGLGCSKAPVRLGVPPELTVVTLHG